MKKTLLAMSLMACSIATAHAASASKIQESPLKNFYISADIGLGLYTSGIGYSGLSSAYASGVGYDFKDLGVPVRAELGYGGISGAGINGYYDFSSFSLDAGTELTPYITAGVGSFGFNAGGGVSYNIDNNWSAQAGAKFESATFGLYSYSAITATVGARYTF